MVPNRVVFCEVVRQIFPNFLSEYVEVFLYDSIAHPINLIYIALDDLGLDIPCTILFAAELSVSTGVVGCGCPISTRSVLIEFSFWKFSDNPPN